MIFGALNAVTGLYPWLKDANFPGVADSRMRRANVARDAYRQGFSGSLTPQQRIDEGFNSFPAQLPGPALQQSEGLLTRLLQGAGGGSGAGGAPGSPAPPPGPPMSLAPPNPTPSDAGFYGGSPETNPLLRPTPAAPAQPQSNPFQQILGNLAQRGRDPNAGLIPKFASLFLP